MGHIEDYDVYDYNYGRWISYEYHILPSITKLLAGGKWDYFFEEEGYDPSWVRYSTTYGETPTPRKIYNATRDGKWT